MSAVRVRQVGPADVPVVLQFIRDLARYEQLEHQLDLDAGRLAEHLFGPRPSCGALLADVDGQPAGLALYYQSYSTFRTRPCLHLEDLFVRPEHRGHGLGLALLRATAAVAAARDCPRLDWNVLDWNESAIGFYRRQGANLLPDWRVCRLEGEALAKLAAEANC